MRVRCCWFGGLCIQRMWLLIYHSIKDEFYAPVMPSQVCWVLADI